MWPERVAEELMHPSTARAAPHGGAGNPEVASARAALTLLLEAWRLAGQADRPAWDFAVEINVLRQAGMSNSQLRWLTCKNLVEHGLETTMPGQSSRSFQTFGGLKFCDDTCFILTAAGVEFVRQLMTAPADVSSAPLQRQCNGTCQTPPTLPQWDHSRQQLRLGNVVVKQFKAPAANQERILAAFEEEGWPCHIDDPLPPSPDQDAKRRLHDTINSLNRNQKHPVLRFVGDGSGEGIRWELVQAAPNGQGEAPDAAASPANRNGHTATPRRLPR